MNESDLGAPLTIGLTKTVFCKTHLLCRLKIVLTLFTVLEKLLRPKSSGLEVEANVSFVD